MTREQQPVNQPDPKPPAPSCCDRPCCQELLICAADGTLCAEQPLEPTLDHLERAQ
ncbi:hypothetical protein [uncultured Tateyamaria sp.]|uniref:hypothetical protein n=1 Tax=Tateyamaria sp. 1078 TaxID=3417464 RepID=UPI0026371B67|nr:hypothetical protein [uncultured Tateyamaria sp.]